MHGLPQRAKCRHISRGDQDRWRGRRDDDRPGIQPCLPAEAGTGVQRQAADPGDPQSLLDQSPAGDLAHRACRRGGGAGRPRRPGPARAAPGALRRAEGGERRAADRRKVRAHLQPACREIQAHRHGADSRGPQDRRADAAHGGTLQPLLRRLGPPVALWDHRPRRRAQGGGGDGQASRHPQRRRRCGGGLPLRRQSAEGGDRQMADGDAADHPAQRSDPRHRRRHQAGDLSAPAPARRCGGGDHLLFDRL